MTTEAQTGQATGLHGGRLVAKRLQAHGVTKLFTLSGGHLFSIYDGCREEGIDIVDVRHEQSAAFAAEGWAKATREVGVCALTAGPGVTNGVSAMASAQQNRSPMLALGGRAPAFRWGQGSLQEIDHVPFVAPVTKLARTAGTTAESPAWWTRPCRPACAPPSGPAFIDFPLDQVFMEAEVADLDTPAASPDPLAAPAADSGRSSAPPPASRRAAAGGDGRHRAVLGAWGGGPAAALRRAVGAGLPQRPGAGCVLADHPLFFSRARGAGLKGADVALVIGVPMDFQLGFGGSFGDDTQIVVLGSAAPERPHPREVAAELYGEVATTLDALREAAGGGPDRSDWSASLRDRERARRRAGRPAGRACAAAPDARLRRAEPGSRPQGGGDRRRRRLRLVRRAHDRDLRAGLLDGPRPLRLSRRRAGLRAGREAGSPRAPGLPAARRRRLRLLRLEFAPSCGSACPWSG